VIAASSASPAPSAPSTPDQPRCVRIYSDEHRAWWRPFGHGYTDTRADAGVWTKDEAIDATKHCGPEKKITLEFGSPAPSTPADGWRKIDERAKDENPWLLWKPNQPHSGAYRIVGYWGEWPSGITGGRQPMRWIACGGGPIADPTHYCALPAPPKE
jgi:hypothetical protein